MSIPFSNLRAQLKRRRWNRAVPPFVSRPHKGRVRTRPHARPPMDFQTRLANYRFQSGETLTYRQSRRLQHKALRRLKRYGAS